MLGEKVAKVVILSVQLLLAFSRARCEAQNTMSQCVPAYPVPLRGTRCIGARLWYGLRRMLIRVRAHVERGWTYLLQLRWSEHQRAMSNSKQENQPNSKTNWDPPGIMLSGDDRTHQVFNIQPKSSQEAKKFTRSAMTLELHTISV